MTQTSTRRKIELHGGAREMWQSTAPELLYEGPAGTGKTATVCMRAWALASAVPGIRVLWVRQTRHSMTETVLQVFEQLIEGTAHMAAWGSCSRAMRQSYDMPNGSSIVVAGLDNADKIMSSEFDLVCVFEATETKLEDYEKLLSRLRRATIPLQQAICECNPSAPSHWLNQRAIDGKMQRVYSRHQDNPKLWNHAVEDWTDVGRQYVLTTLAGLTGTRKERLLHGRWVQAEGIVYEGWQPQIHLIEPFKIPGHWRKYCSIDFGFKNPFVAQWWAVDEDGRAYLFQEIYKTGRIVADHAKDMAEIDASNKVTARVADHDAEDRETLKKLGFQTFTANKAVQPGLQAVADRLRVQGDGRPRLFVFKDCVRERDLDLKKAGLPQCTAEEFDSYVWEKDKDGKASKEEPLKLNDHGMDAMRYMIMYLDRYTGGGKKITVHQGQE